ncbi:MAG: hypothetical protein V1823_02310 [Chloroflexota bacterium]
MKKEAQSQEQGKLEQCQSGDKPPVAPWPISPYRHQTWRNVAR